jgi:hypothetical protein
MAPVSVSVFRSVPRDPAALVFGPEEFGADPSGRGDNAAALQAAVDRLADRSGAGVIFVPAGEYRLAATVDVWRGIRLVGVGERRPVFAAAPGTAGFGGPDPKYLFHFRDAKPRAGEELRDGQNTTFYSGLRNVDFRIGRGNYGLAACRFRVAQLCSIEDVDFDMAESLAAVEMAGNEIERCRFFGGRYGILTGETVPYWPFYLGDCEFSGQTRACVSAYRSGLTMLRVRLADAPYGVYVPNKERDNHYVEEHERLYLRDCRLENLAVGISMNKVRCPENWLHVRETYCRNVPRFLESFGHEHNRHIGVGHVEPGVPSYRAEVDMGLSVAAAGGELDRRFACEVRTAAIEGLPPPSRPDHAPPPAPADWVNARDLGAKGDGAADDTEALERAIAGNRAVYLPQGRYLISRGLALRPDTCLVGLHCATTRLVLRDRSPGYDDPAAPAAMLGVPAGGVNQVSGLGFEGGRNRGAIQVDWRGEPSSLMEDCLFDFGGRGGAARGEERYYALYVHDGGAGVFKNIWIPDVGTRDGLHVSDTSAPGQIWQMSVEHHRDVEVVLENVANWRIAALQTEENLGSEAAASLRLAACRDVEIANLFQYRVQALAEQPPYAAYIDGCSGLAILGLHCFSAGPCPFANAALIDGRTAVRDAEIGLLRVGPLPAP